jgi:putative hemolysin
MGLLEFWIVLLFLGSSLLVGLKTAILKLGIIQTEQELQKHRGYYRFIRWIRKAPSTATSESFLDLVGIEIQIYRLIVVMIASYDLFLSLANNLDSWTFFFIATLILGLILVFEVSMRLVAIAFPLYTIKFTGFITGALLLVLFPITYPTIFLQQRYSKKKETKDYKTSSLKFKGKLQEFIHSLDLQQAISMQEKKLLYAIASFRDRIVREIMVPRVNLFSVSNKKTILECAKLCINEGYSRIPVFEETLDNIIGVVLSKDLLEYFQKAHESPNTYLLDESIKTLIKPVLFTPETKKIANLLQEFKSSQIHLAIVVDEYGGTEGIVTIEDILEQLVGEIEDEYDIEQAKLFKQDPNGAYIIDGKTGLVDIENHLGIQIPQSPTYDTIGGFIISTAGFIPKKGWKMHYDTFFIEVLNSGEKSVDKVKIIPTFPSN